MSTTSSNGFYSSSQGKNQRLNIIDKVEVVRTNDYTKNISDFLFTPSLNHNTTTQTAYKKNQRYGKSSNGKVSNKGSNASVHNNSTSK